VIDVVVASGYVRTPNSPPESNSRVRFWWHEGIIGRFSALTCDELCLLCRRCRLFRASRSRT
jgi:hypothetical protein